MFANIIEVNLRCAPTINISRCYRAEGLRDLIEGGQEIVEVVQVRVATDLPDHISILDPIINIADV